MKKLDALNLPLAGRHLIEASAGTGKTYNITLLYIRLLLEKKLSVQQILVVTFTRAATEELKGRIASVLRECLANWGNYQPDEGFFFDLQQRTDIAEAKILLDEALLTLDEAAVYTIHGFCKQALTQRAFETGMTFDAQMEVDTKEISLEAVRDWYRRLAINASAYHLVEAEWAAPESFLNEFANLIYTKEPFEYDDVEPAAKAFQALKERIASELVGHMPELMAYADTKGGSHGQDELAQLISWLDAASDIPPPSVEGAFFKYMPKAVKPLLTPLKEVCDTSKSGPFAQLQKLKAINLAAGAINWCRIRIATAKQKRNQFDFNDLINSLHHALYQSPGKDRLTLALQQQYPVALVDEFQDTDQSQFELFDAIYPASSNAVALFMIGDPKQAIYGFRGGDVFAYLNARKLATHHWYMDTNWRSTPALVQGYNQLFTGLSHDSLDAVFRFGIEYAAVAASNKTAEHPLQETTLASGVKHHALAFVYFPPNEKYQPKNTKKTNPPHTKAFQTVIANWCATEISFLLSGTTQIGTKALSANDIAILVRNKNESAEMQAALADAGISSVYLSAKDNVFESKEAVALQRLLAGVLELENTRKMIAALSTEFFGLTPVDLAGLSEDELRWEALREQFVSLREQWLHQGLMPMVFTLMETSYQPNSASSERSLTNTLHLLELLQTASVEHTLPETLLAWFESELHTPSKASDNELRLESDDNLIQIVTQHGSKGLEYPIVFVPFASYFSKRTKRSLTMTYHHRDNYCASTFLGDNSRIFAWYEEEQQAEDVRLLYVAITRAIYRCYLTVTAFAEGHLSPLGLMLNLPDAEPQTLLAMLADHQAKQPEAISLNTVEGDSFHPVATALTTASDQPTAHTSVFTRGLDDRWRIHSFSSLAHWQLRTQASRTLRDPEADRQLAPALQPQATNGIRFEFTKGAEAGNFLHTLLETINFSEPNWRDCDDLIFAHSHLVLDQQEALINWLNECLYTELPCGVSLNQIAEDRLLKESSFYFSIPKLKVDKLFDCLVAHRQSQPAVDDTPFILPNQNEINGMMCGFIDLIFEHDNRYYIVDYKSTFLGAAFSDYQTEALRKDIEASSYDLQFLIYTLALHRYLRQCLPGYQCETHLGGVYYLYLRGLQNGQDEAEPTGIFHTSVSSEIINRLDQLFLDDSPSNQNERTHTEVHS
ncbi:MAG: exodeoxyribonuclease V subunit beta [Hahellaceae bacterium]|nr:exodeoxyribonuclease V subunit beta [Hahellaceae bacterium]